MHEGHRARLRERHMRHGLSGFMEHEALELLLTYAIPRRNTNDIAHGLLQKFGSLQNVLHAETKELESIPGVGEHASIFLRLLGEITQQCALEQTAPAGSKRPRLNTPAAAAAYALGLIGVRRYECVYVVSLDKNLRLLHAEQLLTGTLDEAPLYPRRVVESALHHGAYAVLLVHNHPSGDVTPSESDLSATALVKQALNSIDIGLYDHLIVGRNMVYSCFRGIWIEPAGSGKNPALYDHMPNGNSIGGPMGSSNAGGDMVPEQPIIKKGGAKPGVARAAEPEIS